ncbi:hypothetical protein HDU88_005953 [Geranomyces variabilis]|nr:hypothetical protein HDU88_005953 [Geranomyces variabilis]
MPRRRTRSGSEPPERARKRTRAAVPIILSSSGRAQSEELGDPVFDFSQDSLQLTNFSAPNPVRALYALAQTRSAHSQPIYPSTAVTLVAVRGAVHTHVRNSMLAEHLDVTLITPALTSFVCDKTPASHYGVIEQLVAGQSMDVTDAELERALGLQPSKVTDPQPASNNHYYYIRSWAITYADLSRVFAYWKENDILAPAQWTWMAWRVDTHAPETTVFFRYVGMTEGGRPIDRFFEDLMSRRHGLLAAFHDALLQVAPDVAASARAYLIPSATMTVAAQQGFVDDRERILVALLGGRNKLLNRQVGGYFSSYTPTLADVDLYRSLGLSFFRDLEANIDQPPDAMTQGIRLWAQSVLDYATESPDKSGTSRRPMTTAHRDMMIQQATPRSFVREAGKEVLMVLVGKDITLEDFISNVPFLEGESRAGRLTADYLARIYSWEHQMPAWDYRLISSKTLPFVDLCSFPRFSKDPALYQMLASYLRATTPLITLTFSQPVSSIAAANFYHSIGIRQDEFLDNVGVPRLAHYAPADWLTDNTMQGPPAGYWTIVIPHIHPGNDKYGTQRAALHRVLDLTWWITMYVGQIMRDRRSPFYQTVSRDALVQRVYNELSLPDAQLAGEHIAFAAVRAELARAKAELRNRDGVTLITSPTHRVEALVEAQIRSSGALQRMERCGKADGAPNSAARASQVNYLWKLNIPDLHMHIPRTQEQAWRAWMSKRKRGKYYLGCVIHDTTPADVHTRAMLRQFAPEGLAMGDDWMADPVQRRKALARKGQQLRAGLPEDFFSPEAQRLRVLGQQAADPIYQHIPVLEGRQVKIHANGQVNLYWLSPAGNNVTFRLRAPVSFVPKLKGETRTVHFLANGIGIRDGSGAILLTARQTDPSFGFLPATQLVVVDAQLPACYAAERALLGAVPAAAAAVAPGPPPLSAEVKGGQLADKRLSRHIARNDGLWLFKKWLDTQFPRGGVLSTATLREFPDRNDTIEEHLSAFLAQHTTHPHYATVLPWVRNIKTHSKKVLANIRFLRDSTRAPEQMKKWTNTPLVGAPPQKITFSIIHFGPTLPNPHFV